MEIINQTPGSERVYTSRGDWTPETVRDRYRVGDIKLISAIEKLRKAFDWSISQAKAYLTSQDA